MIIVALAPEPVLLRIPDRDRQLLADTLLDAALEAEGEARTRRPGSAIASQYEKRAGRLRAIWEQIRP